MNNLYFSEFRGCFDKGHQGVSNQNKISVLLLSFINTECEVNYGCNLKWKLADQSEFGLTTGANFKTKQASRPLK